MRLLVVTAGTLGDVLPAVALGRALAARRHDVTVAAARALAPWITGVRHLPIRPDLGPDAARRHAWSWDERAAPGRAEVGFGVEQHVDRIVDALPAAREADALLIGSTVTGASTLAELAGRPWLTWSATPAHYALDSRAGRWRHGLLDPDDPDAARATRLVGRMDGWLRRVFDLPARGAPHDDAPAIAVGASPALHRLAAPPGRALRATGMWAWSAPPAPLPSDLLRLLDGDPPALVNLGSQPLADPAAVLDPILAALRALGRRAVVLRGWAGLDAAGPDVWCGDVTDHDALLPRVGLVVSHGGAGTVERALRHGRPLAVVPFGNDQFYNARRVVDLGLGVALSAPDLGAPDLAALLTAAEARAPDAAAAAVTLRADGGAAEAAAWIEAALATPTS